MKNPLRKKILSLILSLLFSVVSFGSFAYVASAGIAADIKAGLNLSIDLGSLFRVPEISENLTPIDRTKVLDEIMSNPLVTKATADYNKASLAVEKATASRDAAAGADLATAGITLATETEKLNAANDALIQTLITARKNEDSVIAGMEAVGQTTMMFDSTINLTTTSQEARSGETTAVTNIDIGLQAAGAQPFNPEDAAASLALNAAAQKFIKDEGSKNPGAIGSTAPPGGSGFSLKKDDTKLNLYAPCGSTFNNVGLPNGFNFMPCVADFVYYAFYKPASFALAGSGMIFDFILMLSIDNTQKMVAPDFIDEAWKIVRDFSNMLFIFVLLYTGIMTMFGMADWKKVVIKVVVVALLINFSLFFTKVVIDAGNVLAVGIMSVIQKEEGSLSAGLVDSFKPQRFLAVASKADSGSDQALNAIIVFIIAGIVSGFAAYYFFKASLLFFGRLLGFWFLMIVSPFVFISTALPSGDQLNKWFQSLIGLTFAAPVFLFLIYLLTMVLSSGQGILSHFTKNDTGWFNSLLGPVMVATLLILALKEILSLTEKMAGDFGKLGADMANVAMTGAMGVSGIVARQTLGRAAAASLRNNPAKTEAELANMSWGDRKDYEIKRGLMTKMSKSSFDVRNFGDKNSLISKTISGKVFQKEQGVGGREKVAKEAEKKATDNVPELSIFEKQGIRNRAQKDEDKKASDADLDLIRATQEGQTATEDLTAQLKASADAEKAHNESPEAKAKNEASAVYEEAVRERTRFGSTKNIEAVDKAKLAFEAAETAHSSSQAATQASAAFTKLESAKKAASEATGALEAATKNRDEISGATKEDRDKKVVERRERAKAKSEDKIKSANDYRREQHAKEIEASGNISTADKIRKGEESGQAKNLKKLAKEKKDAEEAGKSEDVIAHIEEKIEKEKGNI